MTAMVLPELTPEDTSFIVDCLGKGYNDDDVIRIVPTVTQLELDALKRQHAPAILRAIRDYHLLVRQTDDTVDRLESMALEKLEIIMALEMDIMKVLKVYQTLNAAKRRSKGEGGGSNSITINNTSVVEETTVVNLNLPSRMVGAARQAVEFQTNKHNEVIRVGGTDMITATNTDVLKQLKTRNASALEEAEDAILNDI
jgi:hypothetical protein